MEIKSKIVLPIISVLLLASLVAASTMSWNGQELLVDGNLNITENIFTNAHYAQYDLHNLTDPELVRLTVEDQYENITGLSNTYSKGITPYNGGAKINRTSMYHLTGSISFNGGNSGEYQFNLFVNDVAEDACGSLRSTDTSAKGVMSINCLIQLNADDLVKMKVRDTTAPVQDANIYLLTFNMIEVT